MKTSDNIFFNKRSFFFILLFSLLFKIQAQHKTKLIYECTFENEKDLLDWTMEGPGLATIKNGKLHLQSKYWSAVDAYYTQNGGNFSGNGEAYYQPVEAAMRADMGERVNDYFSGGIFRGGHLVFWNKFKTPNNFIIECDFQSLSPNALHMLMFSCSGTKGEDVFDSSLKKRWGVAAQYTKSDLYNYRVSFYAPGRGTANMRKSPGRILVAKGEDFTLEDPKAVHHLKIVKYNNVVSWYINEQLSFKFEDNLGKGHLQGGQTAIRVMVPAIGLYDNYTISEILD